MAYDLKEARELVIKAGKELSRTGLIARTWGNISARISDTQFVITPSGMPYESLTPEKIVTVNIEDLSFEGNIKPSSEKAVHAAAYRLHPEVNFVIHTHQKYGTSLSTMGKVLQVSEEEAKIIGKQIPTAAYGLSGTKLLADNVTKEMQRFPDSKAVLMINHGVVCIGTDYDNAFTVAHTLEKVCRKTFYDLAGSIFDDDFLTSEKRTEDLETKHDDHENYREYTRENGGFEKYPTLFANPKVQMVIEAFAPFIKKASTYGKPLRSHIDDFCMMTGMGIVNLPEDATEAEIAGALLHPSINSSVFIRNKGAVTVGDSADDANAVRMLLEKECVPFLLEEAGCKTHPVDPENGKQEFAFYNESYSKIKEQVDSENK